VELADDVFGASTRLAEDAVAGQDLVAVDLVFGAEGGQLIVYLHLLVPTKLLMGDG
jgi:hypothetical protein